MKTPQEWYDGIKEDDCPMWGTIDNMYAGLDDEPSQPKQLDGTLVFVYTFLLGCLIVLLVMWLGGLLFN